VRLYELSGAYVKLQDCVTVFGHVKHVSLGFVCYTTRDSVTGCMVLSRARRTWLRVLSATLDISGLKSSVYAVVKSLGPLDAVFHLSGVAQGRNQDSDMSADISLCFRAC
jgi:hypothetical protein